MRRHAFVIGLAFLVMAGCALLLGWVVFQVSTPHGRSWTLGPLWPYFAGAVLIGVGLAAFMAWLAAYATRHGHEERR